MLEVIGRYEFEKHAEELQIPMDILHTKLSNYKVAIRNYTSRRFLDINGDIRSDETNSKHIRAVKLLVEALDNLEVYDKEFVVRWSNLSDELVEKIKNVGSIIYEKGFTSTSANSEFELSTPKEYKIVIQHYNGKYIGEFSEFPHEEEVLIPPFSFFKVKDFDEQNKTVYLEQLADISHEDIDAGGNEI